MADQLFNLKLYTRSPIHVGAAQEKHLEKGIDFLQDSGYVHIIDPKMVIEQAGGVEKFARAMLKGAEGISDLLKSRQIDPQSVASGSYKVCGQADQVRTHIRSAGSGNPIIPGSSIKGAIRTAIFNALYRNSTRKEELKKSKSPDDEVLGKFEKGLMRFIQCTDAHFDRIQIFNSKIFNLTGGQDNWQGAWKHELKGGNKADFKSSGFTTYYECIPPGSVGDFRIGFNLGLYQRDGINQLLPKGARKLFSEDFLNELFGMIFNYTDSYLDSEIDFFKEFPVDESDNILGKISRIQHAHSTNAPLIRMASGSGFHAMTGDWKYNGDHLAPLKSPDSTNTNKKYSNGLHYKSRRLAFEKPDKDLDFWPMGFVQIITENYYESELKEKIEREDKERRAAEEEARKREAARREEEKRRAEEAKKPKMKKASEIRDRERVDAVVTGKSGKQVEIKVFIEEYKNMTYTVRYPLGFEKGTVLEVEIRFQARKIKQGFTFANPKVKGT